MRIRPIRPEDIPVLEAMAEASGFPYPELSDPLIEAVRVVVDLEDRPVIAVVAKRLVEIYLYVDQGRSPVVKADALKLAHGGMCETLRQLGYNSGEAFLPPNVAEQFGRRLERTFRWIKNWQSWTLRF